MTSFAMRRAHARVREVLLPRTTHTNESLLRSLFYFQQETSDRSTKSAEQAVYTMLANVKEYCTHRNVLQLYVT